MQKNREIELLIYFEHFFFSITGISYLLVFLITFYSLIKNNKNFDLIALVMIYSFALFFLGFRDSNSGSDTLRYTQSFNAVSHGYIENNYEPAYNIWLVFVSYIGNWEFYIFLNVLMQLILITISLIFFNIEKKSLILLAYISFLPGFDMLTNGMRQGLSVGFALFIYSISYYRQYLPKLVIFSLIFFHKSTLVFIPIYFFSRLKSEKLLLALIKILFLALISLIIIWNVMANNFDITALVDILTVTLPGTSLSLGAKLSMYMNNDADILHGIFKYYFLSILVLFLSVFLFFQKEILKRKDSNLILKYALLVFIISLSYAIAWPGSYSYRFMYTAFLPALILAVITLNSIKSIKYYSYFMLVILIAAILTYGSNNYGKFNLNI